MRRAATFCLLILAGCGARGGLALEEPDATRRDAGIRDAGAHDAARPPDADAVECPRAGGRGFSIMDRASHELEGVISHVSMAGDGRDLLLAAMDSLPRSPVVHVYGVDPRGRPTRVDSIDSAERPRAGSSGDGRFAVVAADSSERAVHLRVYRAGAELWSGRVDAPRGARFLARPVHNGRTWVVGFTDGFEVWMGAVSEAGEFSRWIGFGPASEGIAMASDPETGRTFLVLRVGDRTLRLYAFDRDGVVRVPEGTVLDDVGFVDVPEIAFVRSDLGPVVLGGVSVDEGRQRIVLRRFLENGEARAGFSAPGNPGTYAADLSGVAPIGHTSGYGLFAGGTGRYGFHGAGQDFVGDLRPVAGTGTLEDVSVTIGAGPCGYVLLWDEAGTSGTVHTALAVPGPAD